nr:hypothetical protein [Tanacetum cinerariifolium]
MMRQNKNLMEINIDALYNILKQNQSDVNEVMSHKKKAVMVSSDPLALVTEKTKEISANMVFIAKMEKVLSDSEESSSSAEETIAKDQYDVLKNQVNTFEEKNNEFNEQIKVLNKKNDDLLAQTDVLQEQLKVKHVVIDTHTEYEALEIEKFKRARENKIKFAYDYGNLNESYVSEKIKFLDDYFQEIINPDFEKIDSLFQQTISLKPYVPTMILEKIIIDLEDEV